MLEVAELTKSFGPQPVLRNLNLQVGAEVKVIIGLNGSGKSTLLKIIAGILAADEGKVRLSGREITGFPPEMRGVGYVPQRPALFAHLTVWHNLIYPLRNGRGSRETVERLIQLLGLTAVLKKKPRELSGGYQSRVSLARALASNPKIMLLDEPLSDVDAATKDTLLLEFRQVLKTMNIPVLYVTHDVKEAEAIGDSFGVMSDGELTPVNSAREAVDLIKEQLLRPLA